MKIKLKILGQLPRKSNSRRIVRSRSGSPLLIKSQAALDYEEMLAVQIPQRFRIAMEGMISIEGIVYYQSRRSDLSIELLLDCLERVGVLSNDRAVHKINIMKALDPKDPRVEIVISQIKYDEEIEKIKKGFKETKDGCSEV